MRRPNLLALMFSAVLAVGLAASLFAQQPDPQDRDVPDKAKMEVLRRGDMVQRVDPLIGDDETEFTALALAAPEDDSHKWFVTLVVQKACKPCEQLRADFAEKDSLKAWVDVKNYKQSWAHWQVYQSEDQTQAHHWRDFRPKGFPCLLIQPPISGEFGDPKTVVFCHTGYDGKPDKLASEMREAVKRYVAKVGPKNARALRERQFKLAAAERGGYGQKPPVPPVSPLGPPSVDPSPDVPPAPAPAPTPAPAPAPAPGPNLLTLLSQLLGGLVPSGTTVLIFLFAANLGWNVYRHYAQMKGIPLLLTDEQKATIMAELKKLLTPSA